MSEHAKRPEPFTLPVILCTNCGHGIDPHDRANGICLVGDENGVLCDCRWCPNDIAAVRINEARADERERIAREIEALILDPTDHCIEEYNAGLTNAARIARGEQP